MSKLSDMRQKVYGNIRLHFCVGKTLQGMGSTLMNILSETLSKKTNISLASGYQLEIASWFGIGTCFHFSLNTGYP